MSATCGSDGGHGAPPQPNGPDLLIATTNPGKLREIRAIFEGFSVTLHTLDEFGVIEEPEETGATFEDNARLKALYYSAATGMLTAADDSGLEIEALDGAPGVHSARWYGSDYAVKFRKIYELLAEKGVASSAARFVCCVALARDGQILFETCRAVEGRVADRAAGENGFGYDPIFFYPPLGVTLAELDREQKSRVGHRGQAFGELRDYLARGSGL